MTTLNFETLCAGFCEMAQVPAPELSPDPDGLLAFHVDWRGVVVNVLYVPARSRDHAFVMFDLGPVDQSDQDPRLIMHALLQANFMSLQAHPPTFACHPETGIAVLQCVFPILDAGPTALYSVIDEGVSLAIDWRQDYFLESSADGTSATPPSMTSFVASV